MMRLFEVIDSTTEDTLKLWKKFIYIQGLYKDALNNDFSSTNPLLFASFIFKMSLSEISREDILAINPCDQVVKQVKNLFIHINEINEALPGDDLIPMCAACLPKSEKLEEFSGKSEMLYNMVKQSDSYSAYCFTTLSAAAKYRGSSEYHAEEVDDKLKAIKKLQTYDTKESYGKLFESKNIPNIIERCVADYEYIFENRANKDNDEKSLEIYKLHKITTENNIREHLKRNSETEKYTKEDKLNTALLITDSSISSSTLSKLLASNPKFKASFAQYVCAIKIGRETIRAPQPVAQKSYLRRLIGW